MVIVFIVGYIVADAVTKGIRAYLITDQRKEALEQARVSLERMTRELREMKSFVGTSNQIQVCFNTIDGRDVSFVNASPNIFREEGVCPATSSGNTLSTHIESLTFSYCLGNSTCATLPTLGITKKIMINLKSTFRGESVPLQSEVYLRNYQ